MFEVNKMKKQTFLEVTLHPVQFYKPIFIETFHGAIPVLYN